MKVVIVLILLLLVGVLIGGVQYFRAGQATDEYRLEVERLLQGGFDRTDDWLEKEIRRVGEEIYGIDDGSLQISVSRSTPGDGDLIEGLTAGSRLPSRSLRLTAEVGYNRRVLLFMPRFAFRAAAVRHKREHPHKSLIEEALSGQ